MKSLKLIITTLFITCAFAAQASVTIDQLSVDSAFGNSKNECINGLIENVLDQVDSEIIINIKSISNNALATLKAKSKVRESSAAFNFTAKEDGEKLTGFIRADFMKSGDGEFKCYLVDYRKGIFGGYERMEAFNLRNSKGKTIIKTFAEM